MDAAADAADAPEMRNWRAAGAVGESLPGVNCSKELSRWRHVPLVAGQHWRSDTTSTCATDDCQIHDSDVAVTSWTLQGAGARTVASRQLNSGRDDVCMRKHERQVACGRTVSSHMMYLSTEWTDW